MEQLSERECNRSSAVAVIDDDPNMPFTIGSLLADKDVQLFPFSNAFEAKNKIQSIDIDLLMLDIMMPGMTGIEFCRWFKDSPKGRHVPVLFLTALDEKEYFKEAFDAGGSDFLRKPIDGMELRARTKVLIENYRRFRLLGEQLAVREMLTDIALHDARTPLQGIIGYCSLLREDLKHQPGQTRLAGIVNAVRSMTAVVETMLTLSKAEQSRLEISLCSFNFCKLVVEVVDRNEFLARGKGLKFRIVPASPTPTVIVADRFLCERLLENLVSNALRHAEPATEILISYAVHGDGIEFSIANKGDRIPELMRERVFDKYETAGSKNKQHHRNGLGLAFCKLVIEAHGGKIWVAAGDRRGASFCFRLPNSKI